MKYRLIPMKTAFTLAVVGLALSGASFAQQTLPPAVLGTLQGPTVMVPIYATPGGNMDIITDTPPTTQISPGYYPPGPSFENRTIVTQHHGNIVPEGYLVEWEGEQRVFVDSDGYLVSQAVYEDPGYASTNITTNPPLAVQTVPINADAEVEVDIDDDGIVELDVDDDDSIVELDTDNDLDDGEVTVDLETGSQVMFTDAARGTDGVMVPTGAANLRCPSVHVDDDDDDDGLFGWLDDDDDDVIMTQSVRGGTACPVVPAEPNLRCPSCSSRDIDDDDDGLFGWLDDDDDLDDDDVIMTQSARGTTVVCPTCVSGCSQPAVPTTNQVQFNQGVRGTTEVEIDTDDSLIDDDLDLDDDEVEVEVEGDGDIDIDD